MITAQQFERIQQLVQPITAISRWLLPKAVKFTVLGLSSLAWLMFYYLQFWSWHYLLLLPLAILAIPLVILVIWSLLLWDLTDLPAATESLRAGVSGLKERVTSNKENVAKVVVNLRKTRQLSSLLKELFGLVQGVDAVRTIITHVFFLANPLSWLLLIIACGLVMGYVFWAMVTGLFYLL